MISTVKFIPVKHGSQVDLGDIGHLGVSGKHKILGFKPAPGRKREGWIVVLVRDGAGDKPRRIAKP